MKSFNQSLFFAYLSLGLWLALSFYLNPGQFGDNFEQFNWAHSFEWGYWKHPPLTTWLMIGFQSLFQFHRSNTYLLCFLCLSITLFFYWKLAKLLINKRIADFSVLLLSTSFTFTWRAQLFNHNVVLIMMLALSTWTFFYLIQLKNRSWWRWGLFGFICSLTFLTKYQGLLNLTGLLLIFILIKSYKQPKIVSGIIWAFLTFFITIAGHLNWIFEHHQLIAGYTMDRFHNYSWLERTSNLIGFYVQQIRFFLIPIIIFSILHFVSKQKNHSSASSRLNIFKKINVPWVWGLVLFPALSIIALNQLGGVKLANHWGFATFLYIPFMLAVISEKKLPNNNLPIIILFVAIQVISMISLIYTKNFYKPSESRRKDESYPAQIIAKTVEESWQKEIRCPLMIVSGPAFEAGMVSVYSKNYPMVLEESNMAKSPWIDQALIDKYGLILISQEINGLKGKLNIHVMPQEIIQKYPPLKNFYWTNVPPKTECIKG
jgi:4-amino-4-deoxy-L-arabinose transferase-like glycosyltransferase